MATKSSWRHDRPKCPLPRDRDVGRARTPWITVAPSDCGRYLDCWNPTTCRASSGACGSIRGPSCLARTQRHRLGLASTRIDVSGGDAGSSRGLRAKKGIRLSQGARPEGACARNWAYSFYLDGTHVGVESIAGGGPTDDRRSNGLRVDSQTRAVCDQSAGRSILAKSKSVTAGRSSGSTI